MKTKLLLIFAFGAGLLLFNPRISFAVDENINPNVDCEADCEQPPPPPPPPPVVRLPVPSDTSDDEDNRRRSALVSCCLRKDNGIRGFGAYCSPAQLKRAIKVGDLVRRINPDGSLYCAQGTGVVVSQARVNNGTGAGQGLNSPLPPLNWPAGPLVTIFNFLTGTGGQSSQSR